MKTIVRYVVMAATFMFMSFTLSAQNDKMSREDLALKQAEHISYSLAFDEVTSAKFKEVYCSYQKEIWELGPKLPKGDSKQEMEQRFERSQKILDLRKKYYDIYSTFLTPEQISRVYEIEKDMMRHMSANKGKKHRRK